MPTGAEVAYAAAVMLAASTVYSTVGFGIGVSGSPLLLLLFEPQTSVLIVNTSGLFVFAWLAWHTRRSLDRRDLAPMIAAGIAGVPGGVLVLALASASVLRITITVLILMLAAAVALNVRAPDSGSRWTVLGAGFVGSTFINATGVGGPLIALTLLARGGTRDEVRCAASVFFFVVGSVAAAGYALAGLYTIERVVLIAAAVPAVLAGFGVSHLLTKDMNEAVFRRVVVAVVFVTCGLVLGQEVSRVIA